MYQNKAKIGGNLIVFSILLALCAFMSLIMFLDILLIVTNQVPSKEGDISIASVFLGGFLFLSIVCFRKIRNAFCEGKLNRFFEKDEDGLIEIAEIARHMHMKQQKCFSFFLDCVGKGLLKNLRIPVNIVAQLFWRRITRVEKLEACQSKNIMLYLLPTDCR